MLVNSVRSIPACGGQLAAEGELTIKCLEQIRAPQHPAEVIGAMLDEGVVVARAFPPYDTWVRITIGLPAENDQSRAALRKVLATKP